MCGIAGKLWDDPRRPADGVAEAMAGRLVHRGPDGEGSVVDGPAALAHRRLAIVDLSDAARQPMASADDPRLLLVANGEVYNHEALRDELGARGHRFATRCDSEAILAAYREWFDREGPAFVERLEGMFAFALWDGAARRLVLARDRVGQKPLVYGETGDALVFASELGALAAEPTLDRRVDDRALADVLAHRVVPHPRTAWRGARRLPPGHVLVRELREDGRPRTELTRTWRLSPGSDVAAAPTLRDAAHEIRARLEAAVAARLMADVPVGALLSGGADSAAVVALAARHARGRLRTFTLGFADADPAWDERVAARRVVAWLGTEHEEVVLDPADHDLVDDVLDPLLDHFGEPFADTSALPTWLVARAASRHVKVVLTGDGADESFAGYDRYGALALRARLRGRGFGPVRAALRAASGVLGGHPDPRAPAARLARFVDGLERSARGANHAWRTTASPERWAELLTPDGRARLGAPSHYGPDVDDDVAPFALNDALVLDVERFLPDDVLAKLDVATMAHGLEARSPFLDRRLVETAASLPGALKRPPPKRLLRAALADVLPPDVASGPKRGFGAPVGRWLAGPWRDAARAVLLSPECRARGLFDAAALERRLSAGARGTVADHEVLYTLLCVERWLARQQAPPEPVT